MGPYLLTSLLVSALGSDANFEALNSEVSSQEVRERLDEHLGNRFHCGKVLGGRFKPVMCYDLGEDFFLVHYQEIDSCKMIDATMLSTSDGVLVGSIRDSCYSQVVAPAMAGPSSGFQMHRPTFVSVP